MLQLAVAGHPAFRVDELEDHRPGLSYTVVTLAELSRRHPGAELSLLVGSDSLADLKDWHDPVGVVRQAGLLVMARAGAPIRPTEQLRAVLKLPGDVPLRMFVIDVPLIEISSRDLRGRAAAGRSLRYMMPRAVECYVQEKGLYHDTLPIPPADAARRPCHGA
jgi:nicotinate-nucleotide adenylyltransferase